MLDSAQHRSLRALKIALHNAQDMGLFGELWHVHVSLSDIERFCKAVDELDTKTAEEIIKRKHEHYISATDLLVFAIHDLPIDQFYQMMQWWLKGQAEQILHPSMIWVTRERTSEITAFANQRGKHDKRQYDNGKTALQT